MAIQISGIHGADEFVSQIQSVLTEAEQWSTDETTNFLYQLIDIGVVSGEQFCERYLFDTDSYNPTREFALYLYWELLDLGDELTALDGVVIDWNQTWLTTLQHKYCCFRFRDGCYFFKNLRHYLCSD